MIVMKKYKKVIKATVLVAMLALISTRAPQAKPKPIPQWSVVTYAYSVQIETIPGYVGEKGLIRAHFRPAPGFKWNDDYPASFETSSSNFVIATLLKEEINFKKGILCVPYAAKKVGRIQILGLINFSICNKKECLVFRNEKIDLSLIVTKNKEKR